MADHFDDEIDWLTKELRSLIERDGADRFVSAPVVVPSQELFPERWTADAAAVATTLRRLLGLVGIDEPAVHVIDHSPMASDGLGAPEIEFLALTDRGLFEFELVSLGEPDDLLGAACHEVGRAYLAVSDRGASGSPFRDAAVPSEDRSVEAARGSIAAVYLGLGIPAVNAAHSAHHGGYMNGTMAVTEWAITTAGGLSASAIEFALALQLTLRDRDDERALASKQLGTNQRVSVTRWEQRIAADRDEWASRLGLPPRGEWPAPASPVIPPTPPGRHTIEVPVSEDEVARFNAGHPVFRVVHRNTVSYAVFGSLLGFAVGMLLARFVAPAFALASGTALGLVGGIVLGRLTIYHKCSDRECDWIIPPGDDECPGCGGHIVGELQNANDRLEALEQLYDEDEDEDEDEE